MDELKLTDEQWVVIEPLLPPQPKTGRRREHDRQVLNSLVYRLKTGVRYKDIPRTPDYAAKSTVYHWLKRWTEKGVFECIWQSLLSLLEVEGKLNLDSGSVDGSFVAAKRGEPESAAAKKAKAVPSWQSVKPMAYL